MNDDLNHPKATGLQPGLPVNSGPHPKLGRERIVLTKH